MRCSSMLLGVFGFAVNNTNDDDDDEQADWWQIVVPLLTEYRRLLALVFSLSSSFTASYTEVGVGADHCCCGCK